MREFLFLECTECKNRNYRTERETKGGTKLELKKFCRFCRKHTTHVEKKK
jgi:large subunit ribosomal protein L33